MGHPQHPQGSPSLNWRRCAPLEELPPRAASPLTCLALGVGVVRDFVAQVMLTGPVLSVTRHPPEGQPARCKMAIEGQARPGNGLKLCRQHRGLWGRGCYGDVEKSGSFREGGT